jgi:hypothetical protein
MADKLKLVPNPNGVIAKADIPTVVRFIENLEQKHGVITPELLVKEGRRRGSPVYRYFTNDVNEAAAKRWLDEARMIIRSVYIYIEQPDEDPTPVRKYIRVEATESRPEATGYMDVIEVCADDELRQQMIDRAMKDIQIWKDRYHALKKFSVQLASVYSALEAVVPSRKPKSRGKKKKGL